MTEGKGFRMTEGKGFRMTEEAACRRNFSGVIASRRRGNLRKAKLKNQNVK